MARGRGAADVAPPTAGRATSLSQLIVLSVEGCFGAWPSWRRRCSLTSLSILVDAVALAQHGQIEGPVTLQDAAQHVVAFGHALNVRAAQHCCDRLDALVRRRAAILPYLPFVMHLPTTNNTLARTHLTAGARADGDSRAARGSNG